MGTLAWALLVVSLIGAAVTLPLWATGHIDNKTMVGLAVALGWANLSYDAFSGIVSAREVAARERS